MKRFLGSVALLVAWSCGGTAVVDFGGEGGATTTTSSSGTGGAGGVTTTSSSTDCEEECTAWFSCGLETGADGTQLCPPIAPGDLDVFLYGSDSDGCIAECTYLAALAHYVKGKDCPATVADLMSASSYMDCVCTSGPSECTSSAP